MTRIPAIALSLLWLGALAAEEAAQTIRLGRATKVHDGKEPIDVSIGHATPYVIDWNRDGKKDLLVGQFDEGKLRIYLNQGRDGAPEFKGFSYMQAGGKDASVPVT
ncbi:MAG: hypothetical protein HYY93_04595 [Planctomycetes bacterium]|nr:hypothetical protein [Planctomycetota bacterium]